MTDTIPPAIRVALLVILNHVEPGWEDCVGLVNQWLDASNPTRQELDTAAKTSTQEKETCVHMDAVEAEDQLREANDRQGE